MKLPKRWRRYFQYGEGKILRFRIKEYKSQYDGVAMIIIWRDDFPKEWAMVLPAVFLADYSTSPKAAVELAIRGEQFRHSEVMKRLEGLL